MFGGLLFVVCFVLGFSLSRFHSVAHQVAAVIGLLSSFSEPALRLKKD